MLINNENKSTIINERLDYLLQNARERFRNPFIFSFLLIWLALNWQLFIGLIFYNSNNIYELGAPNYIDFIQKSFQENSVLNSIIFALIFTLVYPVFTHLIRLIYNYFETKAEKLNNRIVQEYNIPLKKYIALREDYKDKTSQLFNIMSEESVYKQELLEYKVKLQKQLDDYEELRRAHQSVTETLQSSKNVAILDGYWKLEYIDQSNHYPEIFYIKGGFIHLSENMQSDQIIKDFHLDLKSNYLFFVREQTGFGDQSKKYITRLKYQDKLNSIMKGTQNEDKIKFSKVDGF